MSAFWLRRAALVGAALCCLWGGCARSTSPGDDGHVYLLLDLAPSRINATISAVVPTLGSVRDVVKITYRVGAEEPVEHWATWSDVSAERIREAGFGAEIIRPPLDRQFDLTGRMIPGGTEVHLEILEWSRGAHITFVVDGNVRLRLRMLNPELTSTGSDWVLERLL